MNIKQIMEKINERCLAKLNGKTPDATISAALQREINSKGENSRFEKAGKGLFAANNPNHAARAPQRASVARSCGVACIVPEIGITG